MFATAFIGTGMLTAIPQSAILFISIGFLVAPHEGPRTAAASPLSSGVGERDKAAAAAPTMAAAQGV